MSPLQSTSFRRSFTIPETFINKKNQKNIMTFIDRLKNSWELFKMSLTFIQKDKSLYAIPFLSFGSAILIFLIFFLGALTINGNVALYVGIVLFFMALYASSTFFSAALVWMIYEVAKGKDATIKSGVKRALENMSDIIAYAVVSLLIAGFASKLREKGGIVGNMAAGFVEMVSGIAGKLVLPAMIITERNFTDSVKQLYHSVKAIPEIATYEIGVRPILTLTWFAAIFIAIIFGFTFGFPVGIILLIIMIMFISVTFSIVDRVYYTLLYLTLIEKQKIKGIKLAR